jgi:ankyrin repeat protein
MAVQAAIFDAVQTGDEAAVREMLAADSGLAQARREDGISVVLFALYMRKRAIAELLVARHPGLDVFEAASIGDNTRLATLVTAEPNLVTAYSPDGFTALHFTCFFGNTAGARLLIDADADVHAMTRNAMANRPLHAATAGGHTEICIMLLQNGAEPNARQHGGWTSLQGASQQGNVELVEALLTHGAEPSLAADTGDTALDLAGRAGHTGVVRILSAQIAASTSKSI